MTVREEYEVCDAFVDLFYGTLEDEVHLTTANLVQAFHIMLCLIQRKKSSKYWTKAC